MNVNMIRVLTLQHQALKAFSKRCGCKGVTLTVASTFPDCEDLLDETIAALIMPAVRLAVAKKISETETAILECANGKK